MATVQLKTVENTAGNADRRFIRRAMRAPLLEREDEQELARRWRDEDDREALHALIRAYMRLVVSTATRFRHYGLPLGDLVQEGCIGLMQAAGRFDPDRDVRFSTYATWWIRSAIQDFILRNWSIVRTGTTTAQKSLFFNMRRLRARIDGGDGPMSAENRQHIATVLGVNVADVEMMEARLSAGDRSLNAEVGDEEGGSSWQDLLADDRPDPEETVFAEHDGSRRSRWLADALRHLNSRERIIIEQRRLCDVGVTLECLGERLGISKERVRQIEHTALRKLRMALRKRVGDPVAAGLVS